LTFLKVASGMPRWSPDSKQIVFDSRPTGHSQLMLISAEGGSPVPLTDGKSTWTNIRLGGLSPTESWGDSSQNGFQNVRIVGDT
jgi:Tol biopolymer transport system component